MELPVFYFDKPVYADILTLDEDTSRHVVQVLRMKPYENLQLTDGQGNLLEAQIVDDHKKRCTVKITGRRVIAKKEQRVSIAISLVKNVSRFEWFLEKATEVGVTEIIPLICERTEKQYFRYDRMKQIVVSAMMQSKQAWLPLLREPSAINTIIPSLEYNTRLIAHCEDGIKTSIADFRKQPSVQVFIGPEGDFTPQEISTLLDSNFLPVSLGANRLRTETAGVVAATVLCI